MVSDLLCPWSSLAAPEAGSHRSRQNRNEQQEGILGGAVDYEEGIIVTVLFQQNGMKEETGQGTGRKRSQKSGAVVAYFSRKREPPCAVRGTPLSKEQNHGISGST